MKNEKQMSIGIGLGVAIGSVIGVLTDNLGLWISLGIAIGAGISLPGFRKENKNKDN